MIPRAQWHDSGESQTEKFVICGGTGCEPQAGRRPRGGDTFSLNNLRRDFRKQNFGKATTLWPKMKKAFKVCPLLSMIILTDFCKQWKRIIHSAISGQISSLYRWKLAISATYWLYLCASHHYLLRFSDISACATRAHSADFYFWHSFQYQKESWRKQYTKGYRQMTGLRICSLRAISGQMERKRPNKDCFARDSYFFILSSRLRLKNRSLSHRGHTGAYTYSAHSSIAHHPAAQRVHNEYSMGKAQKVSALNFKGLPGSSFKDKSNIFVLLLHCGRN